MAHIIVGTAGHIDHGKTALVKALTGIDADRLKEEKERGITIDLGFASLPLDDGSTIGFIDVPGHERFVKNMLAGIGGIDVVMLVIAADESVMPQTREHLEICSLLRIKRGLTVLTKIDAIDRELADLAEVEVREFLKGSFLEAAPILRVSSVTGEGIPALIDTLRGCASDVPPKDSSQIFRLPIDRAFTMKGFGTVVAGTLVAGHIARDEEVEILPHQRTAKVRGIQVHGGAVEEARAGQRTAVNLQRIELADVQRGMVLAPPGVFTPTTVLDVHLELLESAPAPIVRRKRVRFHIGTAEVMGYAVLLGQDVLEPGAAAFAQIRLEQPAVALPGDRFIVRQYSPMVTIGGGEVLDAHPLKHRRADPTVRARLESFKGAPLDARIAWFVQDAGRAAASEDDLVGRLGVPGDEVARGLAALAERGEVRLISSAPAVAVSSETFDRAAAAVVDEVERFHQAEPLVRGIGREDLKGRALRDAPAVLFKAVLEHLVAERRIGVDQDIVHAFGRTVTLGGEEARIRGQLEVHFRAAGLQAPPADEVIKALHLDRQRARKILQLMITDGALIKISEDLFVDRGALTRLVEEVRARKTTSPKLGVGEFKELTGLSRKFALPLLEYLDSQRVTRRVGDERVIL